MYRMSEVLSASGVFVKATESIRIKKGSCVLAAAFASIILFAPVGAHAQTQSSPNAAVEQMQIENQVDINTADAETLALALDGVGMAKAQDIIEYREQNGEFKTADDLQKVSGIGKATLERNRPRILVAPTEE